MAIGHILVVAPEIDLRRSLEFALEAEGFVVTSQAQIDFEQALPEHFYDCIVLDQAAVTGPRDAVLNFCARMRPILLLSDKPMQWLAQSIAGQVEKPMLGGALAGAIGLALPLREQATK
jgi:hypothetical protein